MSQLIDQVEIEVTSGDGGNGAVLWRREKYEPMGGPYGGNGGRGGSIILQATNDLSTLVDFRFKSKFVANPGAKGGNKNCHGKAGQDIIIRVPVGTVIKDLNNDRIIADLTSDGQKVLVAEGGAGGRGNSELATPTRRAPHFCEPGQPGVVRRLQLTLKLLADVGIIGLPNVGKSTLLAATTRAKPKIADYPFTTLEPNLGVVKPEGANQGGFVMADIPGLIEGASQGIGLGHNFLRHIERTRLLLHVVDINSENPLADIKTINRELELYESRLSKLPQLIVLNKCELMPAEDAEKIKASVEKALDKENKKSREQLKLKSQVVLLSAASRIGLAELTEITGRLVDRLRQEALAEPETEIEPDLAASDHGDSSFTIYRRKGVFYVESDRAARLVSVTSLKDPESLFSLWQRLRAMGVIDALLAEGVVPGSEVVVGGLAFTFGEGMG
jgi:GTP-binding protein